MSPFPHESAVPRARALAPLLLAPALLLAILGLVVSSAPTRASAPAQEGACDIRLDKVARPTQVTLGQTVEIELSLDADCPDVIGEGAPTDIVLLIDRSSSMRDADLFAPTIEAAEAFVELTDLARHQVGIVTFVNSEATTELPLSGDKDEVLAALAAVERPPSFNLWTDFIAALEGAGGVLAGPEARAEAAKVVILLSDGGHNALRGGSPVETARGLKDAGVLIVTIGIDVSGGDRRTLEQIASRPELFFNAAGASELESVYTTIAGGLRTPGRVRELVVTDLLPTAIELLEETVTPPPTEIVGGQLIWRFDGLPPEGWRATYRVRPLETGTYATNKLAYVDYLDATGEPASQVFPVPEITVRDPDDKIRVYLPSALVDYCKPTRPFDVVLALDGSTSMEGEKLSTSFAAAREFVGLLPLPPVRAGVVTFNDVASLRRGLTDDEAALLMALEPPALAQGTRIDRALEMAVDLLETRAETERPGVIVLLTDGRHAGSDSRDVLGAAARARRAGVTVYTIGVGADVDESLLTIVAGDPDRYFPAASGGDLRRIYRDIAGELPCGG